MIDGTNMVDNYGRYHIRDIHATIRDLSSLQRRQVRDEIQIQKLANRPYDTEMCHRIEKELAR